MNLIIGFIIIGISTYLGKIFSNRYTKIKLYYENFYAFNRELINKVSFSNCTIKKLLNDENNNSIFILTAKEYIFDNKENKIDFLSNDENNFLIRYLSEIGKSSRDNQLEFLKTADEEIRKKLNLSIENENKYKTLYIKLGFLFGLIIFVIIL